MSNLYTRISTVLKNQSMSGADLAKLLGLKKSPLTDWKNNKSNPTLEQVITICEFFAISSDYILFGTTCDNFSLNKEDSKWLDLLHEVPPEKRSTCFTYMQGYIAGLKSSEIDEKRAVGK